MSSSSLLRVGLTKRGKKLLEYLLQVDYLETGHFHYAMIGNAKLTEPLIKKTEQINIKYRHEIKSRRQLLRPVAGVDVSGRNTIKYSLQNLFFLAFSNMLPLH